MTKNIFWELEIPPKIHDANLTIQNEGCFIQLTDTHIDDQYRLGSCTNCGGILCCRESNGNCSNENSAGPWGDYTCDMPERTFESALLEASEKHDTKFWLFTGDFCAHDIWEINRDDVMSDIGRTWELLLKYAKGKVYPVIGNHESPVINCFPPPEIQNELSIQWLYEYMSDLSKDILSPDSLITLRRAGNYKEFLDENTVLLVVNSNYCARLNFWLFYDPIDAGSQLSWLIDELLAAELNNHKVHIAMHIPPDNRECIEAWTYNYIRIIERFQQLIVGQYFGHTHFDEIRLIYSLVDEKTPIGVQYITPAQTQFSHTNSAYRKFCYNNGQLSDIFTYYFDLFENNLLPNSRIMWKKEYETVKDYELMDLSPTSWNHFLQQMHDNTTKRQQYLLHYSSISRHENFQNISKEKEAKILNDIPIKKPFENPPNSIETF
ncbi:sphingomyelin phosphodiesterase-like protein 2 [Dinothrombium tinctorium]|uniref:Sphingomyelin phosphodiesterase-like protein 2 n=1 Tax=Dinothrombium tinctorium TaxID=1965070 RepID=A0A3S3SNC9_9ACAR|nr:sphingomyelin phosphodiesterase-like protein 2 [Dinothrombium tinctorium]